jgi:hypothetical protein
MIRCICKKRYNEINWEKIMGFYIVATRDGKKGLEIYFHLSSMPRYVLQAINLKSADAYLYRLSLGDFITHFVIIEKDEFRDYIHNFRGLMLRERSPLIKVLHCEEDPCHHPRDTNAITPRNERPQNAVVRQVPAASQVMPLGTELAVSLPKPSASAAKMSITNGVLKLGILDPISPLSLVSGIDP